MDVESEHHHAPGKIYVHNVALLLKKESQTKRELQTLQKEPETRETEKTNIVTMNLSGYKYQMTKEAFLKLPIVSQIISRSISLPAKDSESKEYFLGDSDPSSFIAVLSFFKTGKLHIPKNVCKNIFRREVLQWDLDIRDLCNSCYLEYATFHQEQDSGVEFFNTRTKSKIRRNIIDMGPWRRKVYQFIYNPKSSLAAFLYQWMVISVIVLSVVISVISTSNDHRKNLTDEQWREYFQSKQSGVQELCRKKEKSTRLKYFCEQNYDLLSRQRRFFHDLRLLSGVNGKNDSVIGDKELLFVISEYEKEPKKNKSITEYNKNSSYLGTRTNTKRKKILKDKEDKKAYKMRNNNTINHTSLNNFQYLGVSDPNNQVSMTKGIAKELKHSKMMFKRGIENDGPNRHDLGNKFTLVSYPEAKRRFTRQAQCSNCANFPENVTAPSPMLTITDSVCISIFTFDFILHFLSHPARKAFVLSIDSFVELLVIMMFILIKIIELADPRTKYSTDHEVMFLFVKMANLLRLFKMSMTFRALILSTKHSAKDVLNVLTIFLVMCSIYATILYTLEPENMENVPNALYYVIITTTTVGYGDIAVKTPGGKLVSTIAAMSSLFVLPIVVPIFAYAFGFFYSTMKNDEYMKLIAHKKLIEKTKLVALRMNVQIKRARGQTVGFERKSVFSMMPFNFGFSRLRRKAVVRSSVSDSK